MVETEAVRGATDPAVEITAVGDRSVRRLTSWLPEYGDERMPVVLAGRALPIKVGATLAGPMRVLCIGPDEWLIVSDKHTASSFRAEIAPELSKRSLASVDLSDGLATFELRGPAVRELLSKGCALDLHPRSFPAGRCSRTRFAQIPIVLECLDEDSRFEMYAGRSYRHYLHEWLLDAAVEFEDASPVLTSDVSAVAGAV